MKNIIKTKITSEHIIGYLSINYKNACTHRKPQYNEIMACTACRLLWEILNASL